MYFDTEPNVAESLLAAKPLQFTHKGTKSARTPKATTVDDLSESEKNVIFEAMGTKYGDRMTAVDIYYVLLGRPRGRIALIANLAPQ